MDEKNREKLLHLIAQRAENMKAIRQFDELFFRFSKYLLKDIISEFNYEFEKGGTDDIFKILYDDPYENKRSNYYVQVQLFFGSNKFEFFLNNTKNNPAIIFEGNDFNAKVKISFRTQNEESFKVFKELPIQQLLVENELQNILITFVETVYKR